MQIADGHGRRAADAGGAMQIDGVTFGEQLVQFPDAPVKLGAQFDLLFDHRHAAKEEKRAGPIVGLQGGPIEVDRAHVVVGVDVEHGGDAGLAAKAFDIVNRARMRADKEIRKDLRVGKFFAGESTHFLFRFQVTTNFDDPLALSKRCVLTGTRRLIMTIG